MFQATIGKALIFKKIIESIRELVTDVNIEVSQNGMSLQAMDASHVALVTLFLHSSEFVEYKCDTQQFGNDI